MSDEEIKVVPIRPKLYEAKKFAAPTLYGSFKSSGTLCGNIDFATPSAGTYCLSPVEAQQIIIMLTQARDDVMRNSDPRHDPRIAK